MSVSDSFKKFVHVSEALHQHFPDAADIARETTSQYNSSHDVPDVAWLQTHLPALAEVLLPASFTVTLEIDASGYKVSSTVQLNNGNLCLANAEVDDSAFSTSSLSGQAQEALLAFRTLFSQSADFITMIERATALTAHGIAMKLVLHLYLDKEPLNRGLAVGQGFKLEAKIASFLFQKRLIHELDNTSLDNFETEFLADKRRTVFLVFDLNGGLMSNFLAVCGRDQHDEIQAFLATPLTNESLVKAELTHKFRQTESFGNFIPKWLTPEVLALTATRGEERDSAALKRALKRFQPALAAIFMADLVEADENGIYSVEYRGLRPRRLQLDSVQIMAQEELWDQLYELYKYAYDGFSGDKVEIVQQLLSQLAENVPTLFSKAIEVRDAAKKTHDRALATKVEEYFEARQSIEERIQTAIAELTNDMITLSREVSADVYKVMGIIALATAGSFFKTDVGYFTLFLGFLVVGLYLLLVVFYHLPTLQSASDLRKKQHEAYINSFNDVFTPGQIQVFLNNTNWNDARTLLADRRWWTKAIYFAFCVVFFAACTYFGIAMWRTTPSIPSVKIGAAVMWCTSDTISDDDLAKRHHLRNQIFHLRVD